ncbi:MAG: sterol desaturase family protein [Burkholderiaceae bacterium]|nr:sterol desaturase family protein [Roseateles sp.]MBV8469311.1 sterol desaturase family protein [Burkholderiaceae bacterium]
MLNPIVYAAPVFLLAMALEWGYGLRKGRQYFRAADTISSLSLGITSQLIGVFTLSLNVGIYAWAWAHAALSKLPLDSVWVWIGALLFYDFCYYWLHRLGHEVAILWAAHAVHHSSEEYNLSTALRQTGSGFLLGWLFYLPMAVAGVPPLVFVTVGLIDLLYQFWVHTRAIDRLGWLDRVFVTPSNHRVHHGQNAYCLDRNYGGILILWDRLFGTFAEERQGEPIVYGVLGQLRSWSPLEANLFHYRQIWRDALLADNWADRLSIWFRSPSWRPAAAMRLAPKPAVDLQAFERFDPPLPAGLAAYGLVQLFCLLGASVGLLAVMPQLSVWEQALASAGITLSLMMLSWVMERGRTAMRSECLRLSIQLVLCAALLANGTSDLGALICETLVLASVLGALQLARVHFNLASAPAVPPLNDSA